MIKVSTSTGNVVVIISAAEQATKDMQDRYEAKYQRLVNEKAQLMKLLIEQELILQNQNNMI